MDKHWKKMIAPIVVTVIIVLYFIFFFGILVSLIQDPLVLLPLSIIPALLGAVMIGVCIQRIREIKDGEEDDLSRY